MLDRIVVKRGRRRVPVRLSEIVYMEKDNRKINIYTKTEIISFYGRYQDVETGLDDRFACPHRSYMINMDHILMINENHVIMETGQEISLGRNCMYKLRKTYDNYVAKSLAYD